MPKLLSSRNFISDCKCLCMFALEPDLESSPLSILFLIRTNAAENAKVENPRNSRSTTQVFCLAGLVCCFAQI